MDHSGYNFLVIFLNCGKIDYKASKTKKARRTMGKTKRLLLSLGILLVDLVIFYLPLTALFLIYILMFIPPWFRDFLNHMDDSTDAG